MKKVHFIAIGGAAMHNLALALHSKGYEVTGSDDEVKKEWAEKIPLRRGGTPEDVANVATFLGSDLSSYVSGQVIHCCGGMNM